MKSDMVTLDTVLINILLPLLFQCVRDGIPRRKKHGLSEDLSYRSQAIPVGATEQNSC